MSAAAATDLRTAIFNALAADPDITNRIGANRIYEEAPPQVDTPYVILGGVRVRDWSTSSDDGSEHIFDLEIWSRHHGVSECMDIAELVETVLYSSPPALLAHTLVQLRLQAIESGRRERAQLTFARLRYRALLEPL